MLHRPRGQRRAGDPNGIGTTGIGTGPFKLSSFEPAGTGSIEAFEDHFAGRPVLDGIDFYSIQDTTARVNALLAGQIDLISQTNLDFATAQVVSASSTRHRRPRRPNAQWYTIPMLFTSAEFSDPLVRQAMKLAYDPQAIVDTALQGTGSPGWDNPVPPTQAVWLDEQRAARPRQGPRTAQAGRSRRVPHRDLHVQLRVGLHPDGRRVPRPGQARRASISSCATPPRIRTTRRSGCRSR